MKEKYLLEVEDKTGKKQTIPFTSISKVRAKKRKLEKDKSLKLAAYKIKG